MYKIQSAVFKRRNFTFILLILIASCSEPAREEKLSEEKPKDSLAILNQQIAETPANAALLFKRAGYFFERNNNKQAFDDISKAVAIDSSKDDYYLLLANINFKGLQIQKAMDAFNKAISLNPGNIEAHLKLAELYLYVKGYKNSIAEANEALKIDKNNAKGYFIKGFSYKETGDTGKAISSFQTAVEVKADYYDAYIQLGNIFSARNHPLALQYYNNALRVRPNSTEALYNRGLFLQNVNELEKAKEDYNAILRIDNTYSDAYYNLGYIEMAFNKDYKLAIKFFTDAIRVNTDYVEAYYNRGLCYEFSGDKQSAVKDYNAALGIVPTYKLAKDRLRGIKN